jgi:hypothetical protein
MEQQKQNKQHNTHDTNATKYSNPKGRGQKGRGRGGNVILVDVGPTG